MTDPTGSAADAQASAIVTDPSVVRIEREQLADGRSITYYSSVEADRPGHDGPR